MYNIVYKYIYTEWERESDDPHKININILVLWLKVYKRILYTNFPTFL